MLSKEEILKIAKLSRLKLSDADIESFPDALTSFCTTWKT